MIECFAHGPAGWLLSPVVLILTFLPACRKNAEQQAKEYVDALAVQPDGPTDFNFPEPAETPVVEWIVAHKQITIPLLVQAIRSGTPRQAGYAAYCLRRMGVTDGRIAAEEFLDRQDGLLRRQSRSPTTDEGFADQAMQRYLKM